MVAGGVTSGMAAASWDKTTMGGDCAVGGKPLDVSCAKPEVRFGD